MLMASNEEPKQYFAYLSMPPFTAIIPISEEDFKDRYDLYIPLHTLVDYRPRKEPLATSPTLKFKRLYRMQPNMLLFILSKVEVLDAI